VYDREEFLALHDWEPYFVSSDDGAQEVQYKYGTINGRMLGTGEPLRVKQGERMLLHLLNASATLAHTLALPGHVFQVIALDGRPVPTQAKTTTLRLGPAERVSAMVRMDQPGVWVLGETDAKLREAGIGIVVEYADQAGKPKWVDPASLAWNYAAFGDATAREEKPDATIPLVFTSKFQGHGALNKWMINGKSFPEQQPLTFMQGLRHRLIFDNRSMDDHPVHLHRHVYELKFINSVPTSGVFKDTVVVKAGTRVEVDVIANNPGPTLFHCHQQDHMDLGFMALFQYN
jgi:FtsP/CotA-like multicopper oxidase with cupredoxin domain